MITVTLPSESGGAGPVTRGPCDCWYPEHPAMATAAIRMNTIVRSNRKVRKNFHPNIISSAQENKDFPDSGHRFFFSGPIHTFRKRPKRCTHMPETSSCMQPSARETDAPDLERLHTIPAGIV